MSSITEHDSPLTDKQALETRGYRIGCKIGKGSYANVTKAEFTDKTGATIQLACKIVNKKKAPRDFLDKFFPRELDILKQLDCPYIIQTHSIMQRGTKIFIFMRHAENGDLLDYMKANGALSEAQSRVWFHQMSKALEYLHLLNVAHRDLKCENVLLSKHMNIKLADFGFARFCTDANGNRILSQTYCGSGTYAAPEVVSGIPYNPKIADIWSLGVVLFIMVNSSMPFDDTNLKKLVTDQKAKRYQFASKLDPPPTPKLRIVINSILEPDIMLRWNLKRILNCEWLKPDCQKNELGTSSLVRLQ